MTEIRELLERVKAATGSDRELDVDIGNALPPSKIFSSGHWFDRDDFVRYPAVTASIDAALALVGRVLPGPMVDMNSHSGTGTEWQVTLTGGKYCHAGLGETAPLAILAALLTALQETQK